MVEFLSFAMALNDLRLNGIPLSEIFLIVFLGYILFQRKLSYVRPPIFLLCFIVYVIGVFMLVKGREYFLLSSYLNNSGRLIFYFLGYLLIPPFLKGKNLLKLFNGLTTTVFVIVFLGIVESILKLGLSYDISWQIKGLSLGYGTTSTGLRTRSIFSEPAHFGIFLGTTTILYMRAYYSELCYSPKFYYTILFSIIGLLLTLSMGSYMFLLVIVPLLYFDLRKSNLVSERSKKNISFLGFIMGFVVIGMLAYSGILEDKIISRINRIATGTDLSSVHRLAGQWEIMTKIFEYFPITGVGFGQRFAFLEANNLSFESFFFKAGYSVRSGMNNALANIFVQTGFVGITLFLFFVMRNLWFDKAILIGFLIMCFTWGFFNTPLLWFYLYVSKAIFLSSKQNIYTFIK